MRFFALIASLLLTSTGFADRPIFLVTPEGVYQSIVSTSGIPGPWVKIDADVIVTGFTVGNPPSPEPDPPVYDPIVAQVTAISKAELKNKDDATAVAAIVDSLAKLNLSGKEFQEAMEMTIPIADTSLGAGGRLNEWSKKCLKLTQDPVKLKAGLKEAWGIEQSTLDSIHTAAVNPDDLATGEAINWTQLITIIQMILTLLKNLGIGGGA